jgi:hypothetical protein
MPDYANAKIYTIRCRTDKDLIYVGSTTQTLSQRWTDHKQHSNHLNKQNRLLYKKINEIGFDNFYIELYMEYPCTNKSQLQKKEGEITREIGNMNMVIAGNTIGKTKQEYITEYQHTDKFKEDKKKYYQTEEYKEWNLSRKQTPEYKQQAREYYIKNKLKAAQYYQDNKEHIQQRANEKITCDCGCVISKSNLKEHIKTLKHLKFMTPKI